MKAFSLTYMYSKKYWRGFTSIRQGFGSFHSEDIEVLIRQEISRTELSTEIGQEVDEEINIYNNVSHINTSNMFLIDDKFTFLNHGAFGGALRVLMNEASQWRHHCEKQPLRFFDRELFTEMAFALQQVAKFINCPAVELLPLQNVTTGLNSVFNSTESLLGPQDNVVCLSLTYGSTKKMLKDLCIKTGATLQIVPLNLPVEGKQQIVDTISRSLNKNTKLIVIDHITSNTAMELPILEIGAACREFAPNATIVIDAAHSMMSQHISIYPTANNSTTPSISSIADVWLTNGHKWLSAPKGCAFMWLSPTMKNKIRPAIISHGFHQGTIAGSSSNNFNSVYSASDKILSGFSWDGCRDYSSLLCVSSAIKLWSSLPPCEKNSTIRGLEGCRSYMRATLRGAVQLLMREWSLEESDFAAPLELRENSPIALVPLPLQAANIPNTRKNVTDNEAFKLQEILHHKYKIEVPIKCLEGRLYVRISAHIYNTLDQYEYLAYAIREMNAL